MGLFGGSKKTYVSSVPYNLAGDEADRMNYLKTTIIGGVFSSTGASMGEIINGNYLAGPGIGLRSFARWARNSGYNETLGMTSGGLVSNPALDYGAIEAQLSTIKGKNVILQTAEIGSADYTYWADQYMFANFYAEMDSAWRVDFDELANELVITLADASVHRFTPVGFDKAARYLYTSFTPTDEGTVGPLVTGEEIILPSGSAFPDTSGYTLTSDSTIASSADLNTHTYEDISYSDGRPGEIVESDSTRTETYTTIDRVYERTVYKGIKPGTSSVWEEFQYMNQIQQVDAVAVVTGPVYSETIIAGGVIRKVWTTTTRQELNIVRSYRVDTKEIINKSWNRAEVYIYKQDSGNIVFDSMFNVNADRGNFLPFIPLRIDNKFVSDSFLPDVYTGSKKALKKAIRASYDELIENIGDNENLKDIDFAYIVFGVALNTKDKDCRRYIYEFLLDNMYGGATGSDFVTWKAQWNAAKASQIHWQEWWDAQAVVSDPLFGVPEPLVIPYPSPKDTTIRVSSFNRSVMNYDMSISWAGIDEVRGNGQLRPGAKMGDMWFDTLTTEDFYQNILLTSADTGPTWTPYLARTVSHVRLNWQDSSSSWRYLDLYGLRHENMVYGGKSVVINATEAIADSDESGFIVPIHERIFKSLPLKTSTQVSTACCFVVFNCYTIVKKKWYQTGIFRLFLVVVIAVVSIYFPPAGGSAGGILGANSVVGATLGFTGTAALVAGAVANAIAAMILSQLLMVASVKLFGAKFGAIIGAIASMFAIQVGTAFAAGQTASSMFIELMKADNLLRLTDVFGKGLAQYLQASASEYLGKAQDVLEEYGRQSQVISSAFEENIGFGRGVIDPTTLGDSSWSLFESQDTFLQRTLMTGSDIAELSNSMISNFTELTINQDLLI